MKNFKEFDEVINRYGTNSCKWDECREACGKDVLQLSVADMDFKSPKEILDKLHKIVEHGVFGYTMFPESYYESVVKWYKKRHNWEIQKDWIVYSPRVGIGASLVIQNMTEKGDGIILQTPAYPTLREVIVKNERKLIENPLVLKNGRYEINLDGLEKQIDEKTKMFVLCNPHNPTGRVFSLEELLKIIEFCKKHNLIILSDEIHGDLVFKPNKHIPIASIPEAKDISVVCSSITKTFNVPGIITSNMIIPNKEIREKVEKILDIAVIHNPNIFSAGITEVAYNECEYWLDDVLEYILENKNYLKDYLEKHIPKLKLINSEGTYLCWIDYRELGIDGESLQKLLIDKAGVNVYMGEHFGDSGKGFIRVNLGAPKSIIEKFLVNIEKVLKDY